MRKTRPLMERFMEKVSPCPVTGCWWWTAHAGAGSNGRAKIGLGGHRGGQGKAHRVAYELFVGPITGGLWALHRCGNGHLGCVNPSHLYLGDHADNMRDKVAAGSGKGERHGSAKLTDALVREIRASTELQRVVAARLGVAQTVISKVRRRETWSHVA